MRAKKNLTLTILIVMLLILPALTPTASASTSYSTNINSSGRIVYEYFFDKQIIWNDGSEEYIRLGKDGFFLLNGTRKNIIGFELGTTGLSHAFWDPIDLAIINKELDYLESIGIRAISLDLYYVGLNNEQQRYSPILDLLRDHKMLVFPIITGKNLPGSGNLTIPDFNTWSKYGNDTMGDWVTRWLNIVLKYDNIVAISAENELDCPNSSLCKSDTQLINYIDWLIDFVKSKTALPVTSKLVYDIGGNVDLKKTILMKTSFTTANTYSFNLTDNIYRLERWTNLLRENSLPTMGWWIGELNKYRFGNSGVEIDTSSLTKEYIQSSFDYGASAVFLWTMNRHMDPNNSFFDVNGNPSTPLLSIEPFLKAMK